MRDAAVEAGRITREFGHRISDLDALRGVAIGFVLLAHLQNSLISPAPAWTVFLTDYFFVGVDIFFAISGYIIGRSLWGELTDAASAAGRWRVTRQFWLRRARRLLPAAALWAALTCLFSLYFNESGAFRPPAETAVAGLAAIFDFENVLLVFRLHHQTEPGPLFHYWSLSFEEQFYFAVPFLILLRRRWLILALCLISPIILASLDAYEGAFRFEDLLGGILIARLEIDIKRFWHKVPNTAPVRWGIFMLSIAVLVGLVALAGREWPLTLRGFAGVWIYSVGVALLSMLLVLIASADRGLLLGRGWIYRLSLWMGRRSYSLYLTHICAFLGAKELMFRLAPVGAPPDGLMLTGAIGFTLLALFSWATYTFVEVPTRSRRSGNPATPDEVSVVTLPT